MVIAIGSYPIGRRFESHRRYQNTPEGQPSGVFWQRRTGRTCARKERLPDAKPFRAQVRASGRKAREAPPRGPLLGVSADSHNRPIGAGARRKAVPRAGSRERARAREAPPRRRKANFASVCRGCKRFAFLPAPPLPKKFCEPFWGPREKPFQGFRRSPANRRMR